MRLPTFSQLLACSCLLAGAATPLAWASPVQYDVTVNTTPLLLSSGYLDLQLNPAGTAGDQSATATISSFLTDGSLNGSASGNSTTNATGNLPGTVVLTENAPNSADYTEGITYGTTITFELTLDGSMIESPNGQGGGTTFYLYLDDSNGNNLLATDGTGAAGYVTINPNGTTTVMNGPDATFAPVSSSMPGTVPEPATWALLGAGLLGIGASKRQRK